MTPPELKLQYRGPRKEHQVFAVDLGKHKIGISTGIVRDGRESAVLVDAVTLQHPKRGRATPDEVADMVLDWVEANTKCDKVVFVAEWPMKYKNRRDLHADIDSLLAVGAALHRKGVRWRKKWYPAQWKGNVPKVPHHRRLRKALTDRETARLKQLHPQGLGHDALDALGIFLFAVGRTKRGGV